MKSVLEDIGSRFLLHCVQVKQLIGWNHVFCAQDKSRAGKQTYVSLVRIHNVSKIRSFGYLQAHSAFSYHLSHTDFRIRLGSTPHDAGCLTCARAVSM